MKIGDLITFKGSWADGNHLPRVGIVTEVWSNGRTKQYSHADIFWENGTHGNVLVKYLEVINETR